MKTGMQLATEAACHEKALNLSFEVEDALRITISKADNLIVYLGVSDKSDLVPEASDIAKQLRVIRRRLIRLAEDVG